MRRRDFTTGLVLVSAIRIWHGENVAVIVAYRDFVGAEPAQDFKDFLMSIPRVGLEIKPSRHRPRRIEL